MSLQGTSEVLSAASFRSPKTVLGFFAAVIALVLTAASFLVAVLAREAGLHGLVLPVLGYLGVLIVAVLLFVCVAAWKDPTMLMLGQVTGEAYLANKKLTMGDSSAGEYQEVQLRVTRGPTAVPEQSADDESEGQP